MIGGTNRVLSGAAELAGTAAQVYMIAPDPFAASTPLGQALCQHPGVEFIQGWKATRAIGYNKQVSLTITRHDHARELNVDRVFVALDLVPNSAMVRNLVKTDSNGFILVNDYHKTSQPGLFAAGDVSSSFSDAR